jgi:hypothetical protein
VTYIKAISNIANHQQPPPQVRIVVAAVPIESEIAPPRAKAANAIMLPITARMTAYSAADAPLLSVSSFRNSNCMAGPAEAGPTHTI